MPPHHHEERHRQATQAGLPAQDRRWWRSLPKLGCSAATPPPPTLAQVDCSSSPEQREHSFDAPTHRCFSTPPSKLRAPRAMKADSSVGSSIDVQTIVIWTTSSKRMELSSREFAAERVVRKCPSGKGCCVAPSCLTALRTIAMGSGEPL